MALHLTHTVMVNDCYYAKAQPSRSWKEKVTKSAKVINRNPIFQVIQVIVEQFGIIYQGFYRVDDSKVDQQMHSS